MKTQALVMLAIIATAPAAAQGAGFYGSAGYTMLSADEDGADVELGALTGRGGVLFTPNFGAEVEASVGIQDETYVFVDPVFGEFEASLGLNYAFGAFGRAQADLGEFFTVYGRLGYVYAEVEAEVSAFGITESESDTGSGLAYGAGGEFRINERFAIYLDYTRYDVEVSDINGLSIGGKVNF